MPLKGTPVLRHFFLVLGIATMAASVSGQTQGPQGAASPAPAQPRAAAPHVRANEVGGQLGAADQRYSAISGARLKGYVE